MSRHGTGDGVLPVPAEVLFLSGAPGSGKGTNTKLIMKERGMSAPPVVVSDLLNSYVELMRVFHDAAMLTD